MQEGRKGVFFRAQQTQRIVVRVLREVRREVVDAVELRHKDSDHALRVLAATVIKRLHVSAVFALQPRKQRTLVQVQKRGVGDHAPVGALGLEVARVREQDFVVGHGSLLFRRRAARRSGQRESAAAWVRPVQERKDTG